MTRTHALSLARATLRGYETRHMDNSLSSPIAAIGPSLSASIRGSPTPLLDLLVRSHRPPLIALSTAPPHRDAPIRNASLHHDVPLSATELAALGGSVAAHEPCPRPATTLAETSDGRSPNRSRAMDARTSAALTEIGEAQPGQTIWTSAIANESINFFIRLPHCGQTIVNNVRLSVMA